MSMLSIFEREDETYTIFEGGDPIPGNELGEFEDERQALQAAKGERKDVILVNELGETGGYTKKLELDGFQYQEK